MNIFVVGMKKNVLDSKKSSTFVSRIFVNSILEL